MRVVQEEDRVPGKLILLVMLGALVISAGGVLTAWLLMATGEQALGPAAVTSTMERERQLPSSIHTVDIALFDGPPLAAQQSQGKRHRLQSYGWVSREAGVIHIPIGRAMELYLQNQREVQP